MKVLHVINNLGVGGAEKLLTDSLPLFEHNAEVVDLLLIDGSITPFMDTLKGSFKGRVFSLNTKGKLYSFKFIMGMHRYLRNYDICHVHLFPSLYFVALCKYFYRLNTRLIFTEHSTYNRRLNNFFYRKIDRLIYTQYERVICITEQVKDVLLTKLKLKPNKCRVINNGINVQRFYNSMGYKKGALGFEERDVLLMQVSRFSEEKDQKTVISSLVYLSGRIKLVLIGDGPFRNDCERLAGGLGLASRVKFLGVRMDIPELLRSADVVIQSSHYEGFGIAAVEGMASGKPVIASDVQGLREVVKGAGLLFTKGNAQDLACKVKQLLNNTAYYEEVSKSCLKRSIQYSIENLVDSTIDLYKRTLDDAS